MATITNTNGAFGYGVNADAKYPRTVDTFIAGAAISRGMAVRAETDMTATVGLTVVKTSDALGETFLGIALEDVAAGDTINVVTRGYALGLTDTTNALGEGVTVAAAGVLETAGLPAETDVAYDIVGIWLGAKDDIETGYGPLWVS